MQEDGGSFWEPGNYRRSTQRVSDGQRLCKDMVAMLKERADIEKGYAKELHAWAGKWRELVRCGPDYGTTQAMWTDLLAEGEKLGDLHLKMKDKLCNDVIKEVKTWKKDAYHKSMLQIKEKKEMEEAFRSAQKPWEKLFNKVEVAKAEYHAAFRAERSIFHQLRNAFADKDISLSHVKKIQDRSVQCRDNLLNAKGKYEAALRDVHLYNPTYVDDMSAVFDRSQEKERERMQFFKKIMFSVHKCLDLTQNPNFQQIYEELYAGIENADPEKDLQWWSQKYGAHMDMKLPTFEEFQYGWREIVKGKSKTEVAYGTTLTNWRAVGEDSYESSLNSEISALPQTDSSDKKASKSKQKIKTLASAITIGKKRGKNPFDDYESDNETLETFVDCGDTGIQVRALYDYEGKDVDELDFKEGDVFEKLDEPDENGWCKGRKDGRVGLYPANYVEVVKQ